MILDVLIVLLLGVAVCVRSIHHMKSPQHLMSGDARSFVFKTLAANGDPEMAVYMIAARSMMEAGVSPVVISDLIDRAYAAHGVDHSGTMSVSLAAPILTLSDLSPHTVFFGKPVDGQVMS
jgi:hypothetical protein